MKSALFVMIVLAIGCRKPTSSKGSVPSVVDAGSSTLKLDAGAPMSSVAEPSVPAQDSGLNRPYRCTLAAYKDARAKARTALAAKRYDDAVLEFRKALQAVPHDESVHAELGYALLLGGNLEEADKHFVQATYSQPRQRAQIWFNRGLVAERMGREAEAVACFATSDALYSSAATKRKLKDKGCLAVVNMGLPERERLDIASGWKGVYALLVSRISGQRGEMEKKLGAPSTSAEARRRMCENVKPGMDLDGKEHCVIQLEVRDTQVSQMEVFPLSGDRFALVPFVHGGGASFGESRSGYAELVGERILVVRTRSEIGVPVYDDNDCPTDMAFETEAELRKTSPSSPGGEVSIEPTEFVVFETKSGEQIFGGTAWGGVDNQVVFRFTPSALSFHGSDATRVCRIATLADASGSPLPNASIRLSDEHEHWTRVK